MKRLVAAGDGACVRSAFSERKLVPIEGRLQDVEVGIRWPNSRGRQSAGAVLVDEGLNGCGLGTVSGPAYSEGTDLACSL